MELQVGVKVLLENSEGRHLLLKRSLKKYPDIQQNPWDIPGGRIDPGVSLFENLKREVREETNLELSEQPSLLAAQDILRGGEKHVVRLTYAGKVEGVPRLSEEHTEYGWFTKEEIKSMEGVDLFLAEVLRSLWKSGL